MAYNHAYVIPDQGSMKGGVLYDKYSNLAFYADVDALIDKTNDQRDLQVSVKSHTRVKWLGDPNPSTVSAGTRNVSMGIRQAKGALPGVTIFLQADDERRAFTYNGGLSGFFSWLKTAAIKDVRMFGPTGTPYDEVKAVSNGAAQTLRA